MKAAVSVQVKAVGNTINIPVCNEATVQVDCMSLERLSVNITWSLGLEDVPAPSLPDLHDIGMFPG